MPDRGYYVDTSASMTAIRAKYQQHVAAMLGLATCRRPSRKPRPSCSWRPAWRRRTGREQSGDIAKGNTHWSRADFGSKAPGLDWETYFAAAGLVERRGSSCGSRAPSPASRPSPRASRSMRGRPTSRSTPSRHARGRAARGVYNQSFSFFGPVLSGAQKPRDRWKRAVAATNDALGFAVGRLYTERWFPAEEKARAQAMVANLIAAFRERIDKLEWMAPATKQEAKAKLAVLKIGVGYPDKWPEYSGLEVVAGDAYGNAERAALFQYRKSLAKLDEPVDRGEWVMTPQTVNAVNLPAMNAMNFPAAILQPPYFDPERAGVHGLRRHRGRHGPRGEPQLRQPGRPVRLQGAVAQLVDPEDFDHFTGSRPARRPVRRLPTRPRSRGQRDSRRWARTSRTSRGSPASYGAYRLSLRGKQAPMVQGLTGDQQFFVSFAQGWRGKAREPTARNRILTDSHAPEEYRATTVRNLDEWYSAFTVKSGPELHLSPADRVRVW